MEHNKGPQVAEAWPLARYGVGLAGCGYWGRNLARNLHQMGHLAAVARPERASRPAGGDAPPTRASVPRATWTGLLVDQPGVKRGRRWPLPPSSTTRLARPGAPGGQGRLRGEAAGPPQCAEAGGAGRPGPQPEARSSWSATSSSTTRPILKLKELVHGGELGEIHYVYSNRLNLGKVRQEENILWSFAPHDISVHPRSSWALCRSGPRPAASTTCSTRSPT